MRHKILAIVFFIAAVLCAVYGVLIFGTGSGTGFFIVWIAAALFLTVLGISVLLHLWAKLPVIVVRICIGLILAVIVVFVSVEFMIAGQLHASGKKDLDYIIVLGAQVRENGPSRILKYRLDCALDYLEENPDTVCIVSGGQGYNEPFPEARGMAEYLTDCGISQKRIIMEGKSKSTEENIRNSMEYMDPSSTVGIITNDFHVFRAMQIAEDMGLEDAYGIAAGSPPLYLPNNMLREFFAEIKYLLF